jgi:hypothetical protein
MPIRWQDDTGLPELVDYLRDLAPMVAEVIVVDASPELRFRRHAAALAGIARHLRPDPRHRFRMGKVEGVTTGVLAAGREKVVIADDDVRYEAESLRRVEALLDEAELVRPQNYFRPLTWHARLDMSRTLLNRVHSGDPELGPGDFPGTLAVRRSAFEAVGGYDGDVIFENLELMRTLSAAGGRLALPLDLYVRRTPPSARHFLSQRVRQAYDDFAIPARMVAFLLVVPGALLALARRRPGAIALAAAAIVGLAEAGRRRAGGRAVFPASSVSLAPMWVLERGVSAWLAVASRLRHGGVRYAGQLVPGAANSRRVLHRRVGGALLAGATRPETDPLVGSVAEGAHAGAPAAAEGDHAPA